MARPGTITVRPIREDEFAAAGALTLAAYDGVGRVGDAYRQTLTDVAGRIDTETHVLVATDGTRVLGSVTVVSAASEHFEHRGHGDGGFRMLAVAPEAQGLGVGRALLDASIGHARRAGWRRIVITSMEWMTRAHGMYERTGFVRRPDLDVRFESGVGRVFSLDLSPDAATAFPPPGPVPDVVPDFVERPAGPPSC